MNKITKKVKEYITDVKKSQMEFKKDKVIVEYLLGDSK